MAEDIREAIQRALAPLDVSIKTLSNAFNGFVVDTKTALTEIRTDMKHMRREYADQKNDVKELREGWPLIEAHMRREEDTGVHRLPTIRSNSSLSEGNNGAIKVSLSKSM